MPFGHNCEYENFEACVTQMKGKVDNPEGYCASLMRETEEKCRGKSMHNEKCVANHLGPWMVEPAWFSQAVAAVKSGTWAATPSAATRAKPYNIDSNGIVAVNILGHLMKGWSKYGGTSSVWARRVLRQAASDSKVKGILMIIDSPGGTVAGTADLAAEVQRTAQIKPVIAYGEDLVASAAYWVATQADRVYASATTEIGSIGTVAVVEDLSGAAAMEGIKVHVISTGKHKGDFFPGTEITAEQLEKLKIRVEDLNSHFLTAVTKGRHTSREMVDDWATGEMWIAEKAKRKGLIDGVESLEYVMQELAENVRPRRTRSNSIVRASVKLAEARIKNSLTQEG